jgi:hypothetical protein
MHSQNLRKGAVIRMKVVTLCAEGSCCPAVRIADEHVEIGENDNLCLLTSGEWEVLRQKILNGEI